MGNVSSMKRLPEQILTAVHEALKANATIDEITEAIRASGHDVSRSAVGRYRKQYAKLAERQREIATLAEAWKGDFGDAENPQTRMLVQLATTLYTRALLPELSADEEDGGPAPADWKDMHFMARGLKDVIAAAKIDAEREAAIRKNEREKAASAATDAAKRAGATPETIDLIRREILGIA